jgi:hypothetical protein
MDVAHSETCVMCEKYYSRSDCGNVDFVRSIQLIHVRFAPMKKEGQTGLDTVLIHHHTNRALLLLAGEFGGLRVRASEGG